MKTLAADFRSTLPGLASPTDLATRHRDLRAANDPPSAMDCLTAEDVLDLWENNQRPHRLGTDLKFFIANCLCAAVLVAALAFIIYAVKH
jgi:hypothetical protein